MSDLQLINLTTAANLARLSRQRMHALMKELRGPPIYTKINGNVVFDVDVVLQWICIRRKVMTAMGQRDDAYTAQATRTYKTSEATKPPARTGEQIVKTARQTVLKTTSKKQRIAIYEASRHLPNFIVG